MTYTGTLVIVTCYKCAMIFAMPNDFVARRKKDHAEWFCPAGHGQVYLGQTEEQRLRDQLASEKSRRESAEGSASYWRGEHDTKGRRLVALKGVVTRQRNRIAKGKCPCCSTTFKDLGQHMAKEHPDWNPSREADAKAVHS
jgi:uncharacterized C2H2 Zn-finger protein